MPKKALTALGIFSLLVLPIVTLSFWAYTVLHQVIVLVSVLALAWFAYYVSGLAVDRERLGREVFMQAYELKKAKEALSSCLASETQTQIYNARLLDTRLGEECDRARRYGRPLSFLLFSIDAIPEMKTIYGEETPEVVVQEVASFLRETMRAVDIIVRRGEDRFVSILPETQLNQAGVVAERVRYAIEKNTFRIEGRVVKLTVSVGFVNFEATAHQTKDEVLKALERALLLARKAGPNHVATLPAPVH